MHRDISCMFIKLIKLSDVFIKVSCKHDFNKRNKDAFCGELNF